MNASAKTLKPRQRRLEADLFRSQKNHNLSRMMVSELLSGLPGSSLGDRNEFDVFQFVKIDAKFVVIRVYMLIYKHRIRNRLYFNEKYVTLLAFYEHTRRKGERAVWARSCSPDWISVVRF